MESASAVPQNLLWMRKDGIREIELSRFEISRFYLGSSDKGGGVRIGSSGPARKERSVKGRTGVCNTAHFEAK